MECAICFEEKICFKVLPCEHVFCETCTRDLATGKVAANIPSADLKSNTENGESGESSKNVRGDIECPKCRRISKLEAGDLSKLATKYFGHLLCSQCDERKSMEEFRWCHTCSMSICSRCYVDKHVKITPDGKIQGLHEGSKWDNQYPAVRFCLQQLRLESENVQDSATKAKEYVKSYLEGLQEYMYVEIEHKTKLCQNDYRQKMITLSQAYGIDLKAIEPATVGNRSYESMIGPLYELSDRKVQAGNFQKQKYKVNNVPYKDLARHLLGTDKPSGLDKDLVFFDAEHISNKLCGDSIVIGANVIKQPSDVCMLPMDGTSKMVVVTDHESGIFLFKTGTLQLQGPLPLKQSYVRYARIGTIGLDSSSVFGGRLNSTVLITCQATHNGPWLCILMYIHVEGAKHEHIQINKAHHFPMPANENLHLASSKRSLFGLSTASHTLWRLNGSVEMTWKNLYTVGPHGNPKSYCRLGPICDYTDHTEVLITNGAWQSIDIIKIGRADDRLWSVQRLELAGLLSGSLSIPLAEPILFPCLDTESADRVVVIDKKQPQVYVFERSSKRGFQLARFSAKLPVKVLFVGADSLVLIVQAKDNQQGRALEFYA